MFDQIFKSPTRIELLRIFLVQPEKQYSLRDLSKLLKKRPDLLRGELRELEKIGLLCSINKIIVTGVTEKKFRKKKESSVKKTQLYQANAKFMLYPELRSLFLKGQILLEKSFLKKIEKIGSISLLILTGSFVGLTDWPTDILLVGRVNRPQLNQLVRSFQRALGKEINYTVMTCQEYKYRRDITDVFLYEILENKKMVLVDKL